MAQLRCENISVGYEDGIVVSDLSLTEVTMYV